MIECMRQANQRRLGWLSTGVLVLFAFLITLPFVGQSMAMTAHSTAEMVMDIAPQGNLNLQTLAHSKQHDDHKASSSREASVSNSGKLCAPMDHAVYKTHACCFDGNITDTTIMRRKISSLEKTVFVSSLKALFGREANAEQHILAIEFENAPFEAPQLVGLTGARAQFLRTQRLLT